MTTTDTKVTRESIAQKYGWPVDGVHFSIANAVTCSPTPKVRTIKGQEVPVYDARIRLENQPVYDENGQKIGTETVTLVLSHFHFPGRNDDEDRRNQDKADRFLAMFVPLNNAGPCTIAFDMKDWRRDNSYVGRTNDVVVQQDINAISIISRSAYEHALLQQINTLQIQLAAALASDDDKPTYDQPF